jgi:hypothetical protein
LAGSSLVIIFLFVMMVVTSIILEEASLFFGVILILISMIMGMIGTIWFYVEAFKENVMWGLACLFVPFASLLFLILHTDRAIKPLALSIVSGVIIFSTAMLIPYSLPA